MVFHSTIKCTIIKHAMRLHCTCHQSQATRKRKLHHRLNFSNLCVAFQFCLFVHIGALLLDHVAHYFPFKHLEHFHGNKMVTSKKKLFLKAYPTEMIQKKNNNHIEWKFRVSKPTISRSSRFKLNSEMNNQKNVCLVHSTIMEWKITPPPLRLLCVKVWLLNEFGSHRTSGKLIQTNMCTADIWK